MPWLRRRQCLAVAAGPAERYAADASGLAILIVLVGVLKLVGAAVALAAVLVRPGPRPPWPVQLLGVALWGAFGVLAVWFHRRHHLRWPAAVAGLAGAPLLLGLVLAAAPAALDRLGLLPT